MFIRDHKKAAIIYKNQKISYSELIKNVNHFANKIDKTKIKKVAIFSENRPEWYYSLYAGWKNGLTVIPIDYMSTAEEFAYIINDCKPDLVFCSENNSKIVNESEIYLKNKFSIIVYEKLDKVSENESNEISFSQINNENDVLIIYSSGTTGKPKGVIITFKNIKYSLRFMGEKGLIKHEDILLSILPFHHALPIGYTIIGPIYFGSTVVIVHSLTKEIIFCILSNNKISIIPAVPRFFESIIQGIKEKITTSPISNLLFRFSELIMNKKFKKLIFKKIHKVFGENIRYFLSGGAALDKDIINDFITLGFDVVEGYGLTETVAIVSMSELGKIRPGSVGKVTDLVDLKIVAGEIVVKGNIMKGYYNNPNETNNAIIDGWFYTGDLGYLDKDGYLYITSRKKEIIVTSSGKNINPSEIENILIEYSDLINELAVFESSSILSVVIYPHFDKLQHIGIKNIKNYFHENIIDPYNRTVAPYKKIMSIVISENELPKTRLGKLKRFELDRFSQKWKIDETFCLNRKKSETEQKLCEILAAILKKDPEALNLKKNYIELGADSLMISEFLDKIYKNFNVQITFSQMFSIPNINDTARHIDNSFKDEYCTILQAEKNDYYKLSSQQKRLYILNQMDTKTTVYNINGAIKIKGSLNVNRIEHVFRKLIQRHESFRTSFHIIDYEPMQKISQNVDFSLELLELEQVSVEKTINSFIRYFDLKKAPLIRVGLLKENENNYLLIVDMHHIISDGASVGILIQEFMNLYHDNDLKKLDISYKDYSFWQLSASQLQKIKLKKKYWLNQFLDEVPVLNLPYDFHRKTFQSHEGNSFVFMIEKYEKESLRAIAHDVGATLYMAILTVLNILFSKLAANEDIVIGTAVAGRTHSDLHDVIGMFVNTLALRNKPVGEKKFIDFLNEVKETTLTAFDNQEYFFEDLVKDLDLKRDLSRNPIFDIMFILQNMEMEKVVLDKLQVEKYKYDTNVSMFDITFEGWETHEGIGFRLEYCTMLFKQETIEKFVNYLKRIINVVIANPSIKLKDIEILDEEEKKHLLAYNELKDDASNKKTLVDLFEEQLKESSEKIALYFEGNSIRYKELNDRSNQLANYLIAKGLALDETVGIMADRSFELVIGMLGILKAGGAYVPIDPEYPQERKKQMIETSGLNLILTFLNNSTSDVDFNKEIEIVKLSEKSIFAEQGKENPKRKITENNLAYVIYTSGSTGVPKGVMLEHKNLVNLLYFQKNHTNLSFNKVLQFTTISFDVSFQEIFSTLCSGGVLYLIPGSLRNNVFDLFDLIEKENINTVFFPGSYLKFILNEPQYVDKFPKNVKHIVTAGEQLIITNNFRNYLKKNNVFLHNHYGPSETHVATALTLNPKGEIADLPSIGKPVLNTDIYIMDKYCRLVPSGVAGELCIGGTQVGRGYHNQSELTDEKFIKNPYGEDRVYKTGDLAKWLPDGNIEFLGRIDHQVKIRGFRIELGEIESHILNIDAINESVVIDRTDDNKQNYLCAYYVATKEIDKLSIKSYLKKRLPDYMIPSYFLELTKIPLTANAKVNRKQLPAPDIEVKEYLEPKNQIEEKLQHIWSELLNLDKEKISVDANFFDLGGHSLKATILISKVKKEFSVDITLSEFFKYPTLQDLARAIENREKSNYVKIPKVEQKEYYELSSQQKRLLILQQMDEESTSYNMPGVMEIKGEIDYDKFKKTFDIIIAQHESLRTVFQIIDDLPYQRILTSVDFEIELFNSSSDKLDSIVETFIRPFNLAEAPLLRIGLVKITNQRHFLLFDMHHIIFDGTSLGILIRDFMNVYAGKKLDHLPIQYKDYSCWQKITEVKKRIYEQEQFWMKQFNDEISVLNLPTNYSRPEFQSFEGCNIYFELEKSKVNSLRIFAEKEKVTLFMLLFAIFNILVSKLTNEEDIVIGTPIAGRTHPDIHEIVGMFVNTLALRNKPVGEKAFIDFLIELKENTLKAFENQDYFFEDLVEKLDLKRNISRNPIFDIMFILQNTEQIEIKIQGLELKETKIENSTAKFDLTLEATEKGNELFFRLEYCSKLFKQETVEKFVNYFKEIINVVTDDPSIKLKDIDIINEKEKENILYGYNDLKNDFSNNKTLVDLFAEQVEASPDKAALYFKAKSITYRELNDKSNQLANYLIDKGVVLDEPVGLMTDRSFELVMGMLGILKAGGAYVPIDPEYPQERKKLMIETSGLNLILTFLNNSTSDVDFNKGIEIVKLSEKSIFAEQGKENPKRVITENNLAYVIYTSGSTGVPKGVMLEHKNLVNLLYFQKNHTNLSFNKVLQFTTISFDVSFQEIFSTLCSGGVLYLIPGSLRNSVFDLFDLIEKENIDTLFFPGSYLKFILNEPEYVDKFPKNVKHIVTAGEQLIITNNFRDYLKKNNVFLHNHYGPSETHVATALTLNPKEKIADLPSIGKPILNTNIYIMDKYCRLVPAGVAGELCIGGTQVGRGYHNQSELTDEKFIKNPYGEDRVYKTGDLAKWLPDGNIEFLGRIDHQVKIRGFRIELGEIESHILNIDAINESVVIDRTDDNNQNYLCAYYVASKEIDKLSIKSYLKQKLPDYMIPSYFVDLTKIPLTANGKVNRKQLPAPDIEVKDYLEPKNQIEEKLQHIWSELLNLDKEKISVDANFFDLGGNSLKATILISKVKKEFSVDITLSEFFKNPTLEDLASGLENREKTSYVKIPEVEQKEYYELASQQKRWIILHKLNDKSCNMPGAMEINGEIDYDKFKKILEIIIAQHESLRTVFQIIDNVPYQKILNNVDFEIELFDSSSDNLDSIVKTFIRPFNLAEAPLLRIGLVKITSQKHFLLFDMHHIISDGTSLGILRRDFMNVYAAKKLDLLPIQYKDYSCWQKITAVKKRIYDQEQFWLKQFNKEVPILNLPTDYSRPESLSFEGSNIYFKLKKTKVNSLKIFAEKEKVTLFMLLFAIYNILIHKLTDAEDLVIRTPIAGRTHPDVQGIIGVFTHSLALRNKPNKEKAFIDFLNEVKENTLKAFENQDYCFEDLIEKLDLKREKNRNPISNIEFILQNFEQIEIQIPGLELKEIQINYKVAKFDLTLEATEKRNELFFRLEYCTRLFKQETVERFMSYFKRIINTVIADPSIKLEDIEI